jgi:hypothetical protein
MADDPRHWKVLPHGPLERHEANLWSCRGSVPGMALLRRMTVVRLQDGRLVLYSAIALDAERMAELEGWGRPAFLIVPNGYHRLDAPRYAARYPGIEVLCADPVRAAVQKKVAVTGDLSRLPALPELRAFSQPGTRTGEAALLVRSGERASLVFNDTLFNHPHQPGFKGAVVRWMGSSGGPRVTPLARLTLFSDRRAFAASLRELADTPGLVRILVSHCDPIEHDAPATLRAVADSL